MIGFITKTPLCFMIKKWGELDFKPIGNKDYNITRENVYTPEEDEMERKQSLILFKREENRKTEDMELLMKYINKYWRQWWW